jgi:hypothetical protein
LALALEGKKGLEDGDTVDAAAIAVNVDAVGANAVGVDAEES